MAISTAAALIIAGVTAASSAYMTIRSSKAQEETQEKVNENLKQEAMRQYSELDKQEVDIIEESYKESLESQKQFLKARSSVELQAASTGTYGQSIDLALEDLNTGLGQRMADITSNRERQLDNIDTQARNLQASVKQQSDYTITQPGWYQGINTGLSTFSQVYGSTSSVSETYKKSRTA